MYSAEHDIGSCEPLSRHDWKILEKMYDFLQYFHEATLSNEGNDHHLGRWISTIDFLFCRTQEAHRQFQDLKEGNPDNPAYAWLEAAAKCALDKCRSYYDLSGSAAYYAAEVLQPSRKWTWLRQELFSDAEKRHHYENATKAVRQLWEDEYKGKFGAAQSSELPSQPGNTSVSQRRRARLSQHQKIRIGEPILIDSYQSYIDSDPEKQLQADDPLEYWNSRSMSQPDLARFAFDMLAIPATSAECERVFSSAKLLIVDSRSRLLPNTIEANECLKAWFGKPKEKSTDQASQGQQPTTQIVVEENDVNSSDCSEESIEDSDEETEEDVDGGPD